MTLLTMCQSLALDVGLAVPASVVGSSDRSWLEAVQFANEAGEELARRVNWGALHSTATLTGDGTNLVHDLGDTFLRLAPGLCVLASGGTAVRPLTRGEWINISATEGTPRYFLLEGRNITLTPYLATAATAVVKYQTKNFCSAGSAFTSDDNTLNIDESLFLKGLIVRWRRQKGMDFADQEAEYEAALASYAKDDDRSRL